MHLSSLKINTRFQIALQKVINVCNHPMASAKRTKKKLITSNYIPSIAFYEQNDLKEMLNLAMTEEAEASMKQMLLKFGRKRHYDTSGDIDSNGKNPWLVVWCSENYNEKNESEFLEREPVPETVDPDLIFQLIHLHSQIVYFVHCFYVKDQVWRKMPPNEYNFLTRTEAVNWCKHKFGLKFDYSSKVQKEGKLQLWKESNLVQFDEGYGVRIPSLVYMSWAPKSRSRNSGRSTSDRKKSHSGRRSRKRGKTVKTVNALVDENFLSNIRFCSNLSSSLPDPHTTVENDTDGGYEDDSNLVPFLSISDGGRPRLSRKAREDILRSSVSTSTEDLHLESDFLNYCMDPRSVENASTILQDMLSKNDLTWSERPPFVSANVPDPDAIPFDFTDFPRKGTSMLVNRKIPLRKGEKEEKLLPPSSIRIQTGQKLGVMHQKNTLTSWPSFALRQWLLTKNDASKKLKEISELWSTRYHGEDVDDFVRLVNVKSNETLFVLPQYRMLFTFLSKVLDLEENLREPLETERKEKFECVVNGYQNYVRVVEDQNRLYKHLVQKEKKNSEELEKEKTRYDTIESALQAEYGRVKEWAKQISDLTDELQQYHDLEENDLLINLSKETLQKYGVKKIEDFIDTLNDGKKALLQWQLIRAQKKKEEEKKKRLALEKKEEEEKKRPALEKKEEEEEEEKKRFALEKKEEQKRNARKRPREKEVQEVQEEKEEKKKKRKTEKIEEKPSTPVISSSDSESDAEDMF